jgi:SagB-type dehydrogenase family enzyme
METAPAYGIGLCPLGGLDFDRVRPLLALGDEHLLVHSFLGGPVVSRSAAALPVEAADEPAGAALASGPLPPGPRPARRLLDAAEQLEFKLSGPGVRRGLDDRSAVTLPPPALTAGRVEAYRSRRSVRDFLADPVPLAELAGLLSALLQIRLDGSPLPKYRYPSGGSLYPVQTYVHVKPGRIEGLDGGVYYFEPRTHRLVLLTAGAEIDREVHGEINRPIFDGAAFSFYLVADLAAIAPLYGEGSRDLCLLEAGYMGQLLMETAPAYGIGLCPLGGLDFDRVRPLLALGDEHLLVHSFLGGPAAGRTAGALDASSAMPGMTEELRRFLAAKLPEYMVPATFVFLDALPLGPTGKVDRKALPEPAGIRIQAQTLYEPAGNELEETITGVWQQVLAVERVGVHDNFFDLGGHSVAMIQVHNRLRELLVREISIVSLFRHPTPRTLAGFLAEGDTAEDEVLERERERGHTRREARRRRRTRTERAEDEAETAEP